MSNDLNISNTKTSDTTSHDCKVKHKTSKFKIFITVVERISAVALGAFSLYTNWKLFVPFFFVGVSIGIYSYVKKRKSCHEHHAGASCGHGLLEDLTGVKLPPVISLAANIAVTICHIDHHSNVFIPIIGISLGNWIGKMSCHYGVLAYKKIKCHSSKKNKLPNAVVCAG